MKDQGAFRDSLGSCPATAAAAGALLLPRLREGRG